MPEPDERECHAWNVSAGAYAEYASKNRLYVETAAALLKAAEIQPGMTVVDLACGTGVLTDAIVRQHPAGDVQIIATDFSPGMIALARTHLMTPMVAFQCGAAEHLSRLVAVPVDRVLCNAAFWQFDQDRVLTEIERVLTRDGACVITMPSWSGVLDSFDALYETNKLVWMVLEELAIRGHDPRRVAVRVRPDRAAPTTGLLRRLPGRGLQVERMETIRVAASPAEYLEFLQIPVMARRFSSAMEVTPIELTDILSVVRNQLEWIDLNLPPQTWTILVLRKADS